MSSSKKISKNVYGFIVLIWSLFLFACSGSEGGTDQPATSDSVIANQSTVTKSSGLLLGAYTGCCNPKTAATFEAWLGRKSDFNVEFLADSTYSGLQSVAWWDVGMWLAGNRPDRNMLFSIPLATTQDGSLKNVANGLYDAEYLSVAKAIAQGYPKAMIRIGWEFNGNWYPWAAAGRESDYIAAFRRVVKIFRSVSPNFVIDWCPGIGSLSMTAESAYPGDDVVDVIGLDAYDNWNYNTSIIDPSRRWIFFRDQDHGLTWHRNFAALHGKPMSFPEWAVNHDDSYFIEQMYAWMIGNNVAYASYWDYDDSFKSRLDSLEYPAVSAEYKSLFGTLPSANH